MAGIQDKRKRPSGLRRRPQEHACQNGRLLDSVLASGFASCYRQFCFSTAEPAHGVRAHAQKSVELHILGLLRLAVLAFVLRAYELSVNEDMVILVEGVRDGLAEALEGISAWNLFAFARPFAVG
jgi:hypothetical protein